MHRSPTVVAVLAAMVLFVGCTTDSQQVRDTQAEAKAAPEVVLGEPLTVSGTDTAVADGRQGFAKYTVENPRISAERFIVDLRIECKECGSWLSGALVALTGESRRLKAVDVDASFDFDDPMIPNEVRTGAVAFDVPLGIGVTRIVLLRGDANPPAAYWVVDPRSPVPTVPSPTTEPGILIPEVTVAPANTVSLGAYCSPSGATAVTADGSTAYCARLQYTDAYMWSTFSGVIPNPEMEAKMSEAALSPPTSRRPSIRIN